jgi:hypothetical protein
MRMYSICRHPANYPHGYTVTVWETRPDTIAPVEVWNAGHDLESARALVPAGLFQIVRHDDDDPVIVETWV